MRSPNVSTIFFYNTVILQLKADIRKFQDFYKDFPIDDYFDPIARNQVQSRFTPTFFSPGSTLVPTHCFLLQCSCTLHICPYFLIGALQFVVSLEKLTLLCFLPRLLIVRFIEFVNAVAFKWPCHLSKIKSSSQFLASHIVCNFESQ